VRPFIKPNSHFPAHKMFCSIHEHKICSQFLNQILSIFAPIFFLLVSLVLKRVLYGESNERTFFHGFHLPGESLTYIKKNTPVFGIELCLFLTPPIGFSDSTKTCVLKEQAKGVQNHTSGLPEKQKGPQVAKGAQKPFQETPRCFLESQGRALAA